MKQNNAAFTLIELSIVLVIIGLIVGGVLVGRDLIAAAEVRAQMSQIEKYNTAVNTFRIKYGYLPGDMPDPAASSSGMAARYPTLIPGDGDGNGIIQGNLNGTSTGLNGVSYIAGETSLLWGDLGKANLIDGSYTWVPAIGAGGSAITDPATIHGYLPYAKIAGNFVVVWSGGAGTSGPYGFNGNNSINYFSIVAVPQIGAFAAGQSAPGLTVMQAYNIDKKMDDGMPQSGKVTALYPSPTFAGATNAIWSGGPGNNVMGTNAGSPNYGPANTSTAGTANTCYDNNSSSNVQQYSTGQSGGNGVNCALSFQFQ